jgi:hypothetical protein
MQVFVFRSQKDGNVGGFTPQRDGHNLPVEFAPWEALGGRTMDVGDHIAGVQGGASAILDGITEDGFYLVRSEVRVTSSTGSSRHS